jgi:tRNA (guanine37-N1)-methyltransferase
MSRYDVVGNIVIVKFSRDEKLKDKKKFALKFLKEHKQVTTVLEKSGKFSGRLRTQETKYIAGVKTKEALHKENGCLFRFNVDSCYFSPRLNSERKDIASKIKKGERVLVMFGGVAPFAIVIAKLSKASEVVSVELSRECNRYAKMNVARNKVVNVGIIGGDVRNVIGGRFDRIVMTRPNLKESFLNAAFKVIKKGGMIHYYGFSQDKKEVRDLVLEEARRAKRKVKILKIKKAGEIGVKNYRWRIDLKVNYSLKNNLGF